MLIRNAELYGGGHADVRCEHGVIAELGHGLAPRPGDTVFDARGGVLLPGLHDHHLHLYAAAQALKSVSCGPPDIVDADQLAQRLHDTPATDDGWIRGVGYHESVAGLPDRRLLDAWVPDRPVRIQHRTGKLWLLNSLAVALLGAETCRLPGVERDREGRATGRLYGLDAWLRKRFGGRILPDLGPLSDLLASYGVVGVTDTSPANDATAMRQIQAASGTVLRQRVVVMGGMHLPAASAPLVERGAVKLMLDEYDLPPLDRFEARIRTAHRRGRPVAIHCVTRTELIFALTALETAGCLEGDRIEHASVCPDEVLPMMRRTGVTVVTQPGFIHARGDRYLLDVEPEDRPLLYRARSLIEAGISLAGSSDAPYGPADPWLAMRTLVSRRTREGRQVGHDERLTPEQAVALFGSRVPGAPPDRIAPGRPADLCLLNRPWNEARQRLSANDVTMTCRDGEIIHRQRPDSSAESGMPSAAAAAC